VNRRNFKSLYTYDVNVAIAYWQAMNHEHFKFSPVCTFDTYLTPRLA